MKKFNKVINSNNICIFSDFDGTLVPFKKNPDAVFLPIETQNNIAVIAAKIKGFIFVTGRTKTDLQVRLGIVRNLPIIASHGLESPILNAAQKQAYIKCVQKLFLLFSNMKNEIDKNILIQNKIYSVCVNFRNCSNSRKKSVLQKIRNIFYDYFSDCNFEILAGAEVLEFKPTGINKSTAIQYFISKVNAEEYFYFGDDITDNLVFKKLKNKVTTVYVNSYDIHKREKIFAEYYMENYKEYRKFLKKLARGLK